MASRNNWKVIALVSLWHEFLLKRGKRGGDTKAELISKEESMFNIFLNN